MDLLGAALPNVMFIVGILAIGLGLGIELKVVSLNKEIDKGGRIGAFVVGIVLIAVSVMMYLNPSIAGRGQAGATAVSAAQIVSASVPPTQAPAPATTSSLLPPTDAPAAAPAPTDPPATAVPPTTVPGVAVPDIHGMSDKDIKRVLEQAGLRVGRKTDRCEGSDQGVQDTKKGRVKCQNPPAGQAVAPGTAVDYVLVK